MFQQTPTELPFKATNWDKKWKSSNRGSSSGHCK